MKKMRIKITKIRPNKMVEATAILKMALTALVVADQTN
jgi:hypothetical protein